MKNYFSVIKFQLRKKSNILSILLIAVAISITIIGFVYKSSEKHMFAYEVYNSLDYRTLQVWKGEFDEKRINELEQMNHITVASPSFEYFGVSLKSKEFNKLRLTGEFKIIPANNNSLPEIVDGTNFPDNENYYMVCPNDFYPTSGDFKYLSIFDKVNISNYLNKSVSTEYYGGLYFNINDPSYVFKTDIKLVGTYKNSDYNIDEYICYVNKKTMHDIVLNIYKDMEESYEDQKGLGFIVEVDDRENMKSVIGELEAIGYYVEPIVLVDESGLVEVETESNSISNSVIIIVLIFIIVILEKDYIENKDYYKLLNILGYNKRNIRIIYILSNILKIVTCTLFGVILSFIICGIAYLSLNIFPFLMFKYKVIIPFEDFIPVFVIFILIPIISTFISSIFHLNKVGKYD